MTLGGRRAQLEGFAFVAPFLILYIFLLIYPLLRGIMLSFHLADPFDDGRFVGLENYARLEIDGEARLAGYVEASHGCLHRCGHCPIPVIYDGRIVGELPRALDRLADVRDDAVAPASDLVAEEPEPACRACPDRTLGDDATLGAVVGGLVTAHLVRFSEYQAMKMVL